MNCLACGRENPSDGRFCIFCGASLNGDRVAQGEVEEERPVERAAEASTESGESTQAAQELRSLQNTVVSIREDLLRLLTRVSDIEARLGVVSRTGPSRPQASAVSPTPRAPGVVATAAASAPAPPPPPSRPEAGVAAPPPWGGALDNIRELDWDWLVGGNWLARIGIVALVIGVGFFLKLAFDNDWIGDRGRVALGIVGGLAFLVAGEYWQRRYPIWAQPVTGGGLAILYLSIFVAFSLYDFIPPVAAFGLFFLVTLTAAGLALKNESMVIAILGIIGGFVTPILLKDELPDQRLLLAYVLVLDLGVLGLATFRNWRWFNLLGLAGSLGLYWFWYDRLDPSLLLAMVGITLIFLIFIGATSLFHLVWRRVPGPADHALMVLNAAAYFGISYWVMFDEHKPWMGGFTLLLALVYGAKAYAALVRSPEQVYLSLFSVGIGVVFVTIAIPVQLGGPWISVAWAVESAVLIWLSFTLRMPQFRIFGVLVFAAFAAYLLFIDTPNALDTDFTPVLNVYMLAYALVIAVTFLLAYLMYRERETLLPWEVYLFPAFLVAGNLFLTIAVPVQAEGAWIAVTWAAEAIALIWLSFRLGLHELRLFSLGVFAILLVRLLAFDTRDVNLDTFRPIINLRFLAFAIGIASMYLAAYIVWRWREELFDEREKYLVAVFLAVANFLTLWILSAEIISSVDSDLFEVSRRIAGDVKSLSLSILWATYAAGAVIFGIVRRSRMMRLAGLALLAVPVLKLFVFDIFELERGYRVGAFMGLGALLVAGGFLYQRYSRAIRGFLLE